MWFNGTLSVVLRMMLSFYYKRKQHSENKAPQTYILRADYCIRAAAIVANLPSPSIRRALFIFLKFSSLPQVLKFSFHRCQVVCIDYPRPELESTSNFLEAAYLSSTFRNSPRPQKPLEVVIAGAEEQAATNNMNAPLSECKKRKWTSPVWKDYDCFDGHMFEDNIPRALCKYCKQGPILAHSTNGTTNFKRHSESCFARATFEINKQKKGKKDKGDLKHFDPSMYKQLVARAIIRHGYSFTFVEDAENRAIHSFLNEDCKFICRKTAKKYCLEVHKNEKLKLKKQMSIGVSSKVEEKLTI
ncbi:uncharacterized protein LOC130824811 [Amaranthus tricolor]|uniref:uncharacterized protein LOC130824811 n=1 Tax=Amaranthus tricolor TaxID=29722 RepID=UPI00258309A8|nr:uncharacterized protein LOC130824811 [Amaranthus tricolor]